MAWATQTHTTEILSDNIDVEISMHKASGDYLLLWIAPDYGFRKGQYELATELSRNKLEVWLVDLTETLFMPRGSNSMRQLTGKYVAELIELAHQQTGKKIILVSSFYGAIPVLRGARRWQLSSPQGSYLHGALLFSPTLYSGIPALGKDPDYLPIADATNIPIMIFQGEANGMRWQLNTLINKLHASGSPTYATLMPGISSLFYPEERNQVMENYFRSLPDRIKQAIRLFETAPSPVAPVNIRTSAQSARKNLDSELKKYQGDIEVKSIKLPDVNNKLIDIKDYHGKVTLVNFWATWCPPCVEEIPSLNRLIDSMDSPDFRLISINYVESPETINAFLKTFKVKFPVLLDRDGKVSSAWKVIVFPSTYVIGKDGKIKYGVNAAIEWDSEQTIRTLRQLLADSTEKPSL
jgi:thiol-disulfide isomerase/thioredoxin